MIRSWTNPNPITPPPPVPGTKTAEEYYHSIQNYSNAVIDMRQYPPHKNESLHQYRNRLVKITHQTI